MASRQRPTAADYLVQALSPALIMTLVGSLVFFLLEVLYQGAYPGKVRWFLFFFVFGAVLVSRISMRGDIGHRAGLYGLALGLAVWLALTKFVEYKSGNWDWAINLGLILLIWWCAHRLTWDCTYLDEKRGTDGEGVLQAAGLQEKRAQAEKEEEENEDLTWWEKYKKYRDEKQARRSPGVWVIYFSLAALPIFGLGQALIPVKDGSRRTYVLLLTMVYVASGLGLLMTTTFLGLRNYLRQRKVRMSGAMVGTWLSAGIIVIVLLVFVGFLLPRPSASKPIWESASASSPDREASKWSPDKNEVGKDSPKDKTSRGERKDDRIKPEKDSEPAKGKDKSGKDQSQKDKDKGGKDQKDSSSKRDDKSSEKDKGDSKKDQRDAGSKKDKKDASQRDKNEKDEKKDSRDAKDTRDAKEDKSDSSTEPEQPEESSSQFWQKLGQVLKWIVFGGLILVILYFVFRNFLQFMANFTNWAKELLEALRRFWAALFGGKKAHSAFSAESESSEELIRQVPFSAFSNPFHDGRASHLSLDELVRYTFQAFQAWAGDHDVPREPSETPLEHAQRVGDELPAIEKSARKLATVYAWMEYGNARLSPSVPQVLAKVWERMEQVDNRPLSA